MKSGEGLRGAHKGLAHKGPGGLWGPVGAQPIGDSGCLFRGWDDLFDSGTTTGCHHSTLHKITPINNVEGNDTLDAYIYIFTSNGRFVVDREFEYIEFVS